MIPFILVLQSVIPGQTDQLWQDRFKSDAPRAWKDYVERIQKFQGQVDFTHEDGAKQRIFIKHGLGCISLFVGEMVGGIRPNANESCEVINPTYSFTAKRLAPDGQWTIANVRQDGKETLSKRRARIELYEDLLFSPVKFSVMYFKWKDLSHEPGFVVKSTATELKEGRTLVRIQFEFKPKDQKEMNPPASGSLLLDPARYWVIREFDADLFFRDKQKSGKIHFRKTGSSDYQETRDGFPVLKRLTFTRENVGKSPKPTVGIWDYQLEESESPESDFYTPAFDLPDAGTLRAKPTSWYLWLGLAALICIVLGIGGFQKLKRWAAKFKTSKKTRPTPSAM